MKKSTNVSLLDIFLASRKMGKGIKDDATTLICSLIEEELLKRPESERTKEFKDELFANAIGLVRNCRVRCMGRGVTLAKFRASTSSRNVLRDIADQQEDLQRQMGEISHEKEELNELKDELTNMKTEMMHYLGLKKQEMDQFKEESDQLRIQMKSVEQALGFFDSSIFQAVRSPMVTLAQNRESDIQIQDASRSGENCVYATGDIRHNKENPYGPSSGYLGNTNLEGKKVLLFGHGFPKEVVAEGIVTSREPSELVGDVPLGPDFWKVYITKMNDPNYHLIRPRRGVETVGQAYRKYVPWQICHVMEN